MWNRIFQEKKSKTLRENYFHRGRALTKPKKNLSTKCWKKLFPLKIVRKKIIIANDKQGGGGAYVNWLGFVIRIQACHNSSFAFWIPSPSFSLGLCSIDFFPHTLAPPLPLLHTLSLSYTFCLSVNFLNECSLVCVCTSVYWSMCCVVLCVTPFKPLVTTLFMTWRQSYKRKLDIRNDWVDL